MITPEEFLRKWSAVIYEPTPICGNRYAMEPDLKALLVSETESLNLQNSAYKLALEQALRILGPIAPKCEGCEAKIDEALIVIGEALGG